MPVSLLPNQAYESKRKSAADVNSLQMPEDPRNLSPFRSDGIETERNRFEETSHKSKQMRDSEIKKEGFEISPAHLSPIHN